MKHTRSLRCVVLCLGVFAAGCSGQPGSGLDLAAEDLMGVEPFAGDGVLLRSDAASLRRGSALQLTISNRSGRELGFNLCFGRMMSVETGVVDDGVLAYDGSFCQAIQLRLAPGQSSSIDLTVSPNARLGTYRYLTAIEVEGNRFRLQSDPFEVIEAR